jgi:molecular chaperone DnaK (HSP70)
LFGEEAFAQVASESTVGLLNVLVGRTIDEVHSLTSCHCLHRKIHVLVDEQGRLLVDVQRSNGDPAPLRLHVTSLLAMYLSHIHAQLVAAVRPAQALVCFALYPHHSPRVARAYHDACAIAGIPLENVRLVDASDALVTTYARKVSGLGGAEALGLVGRPVVLVDMGHVQTTVVVVALDAQSVPTKLAVAHDHDLGAFHFDLQLFHHFAGICLSKHSTPVSNFCLLTN